MLLMTDSPAQGITTTGELADFTDSIACDDLADDTREEPERRMLDSIGIAGTAHNALWVTGADGINEWTGIARANTPTYADPAKTVRSTATRRVPLRRSARPLLRSAPPEPGVFGGGSIGRAPRSPR